MGRDTVEPWDVAIIGGGILGTSVSYWIGNQHRGRIAVIEKEGDVAVHTSRRNTGVVHRPFYLDPAKRRVFARSSDRLWDVEVVRESARSPVGSRNHSRSCDAAR